MKIVFRGLFKHHHLRCTTIFLCIAISVASSANPQDEIKINSVPDFKNIAKRPFGNYHLDADLLLKADSGNYKPFPFYGSLDGNGHTIHISKITCKDESPCGLFSVISNDSNAQCAAVSFSGGDFYPKCETGSQAEISDLRVIVDTLNCKNSCGILAGEISRAKINKIITSGNVLGGSFVGGIAGKAGPFVEASRLITRGSVSGVNFVGGIFGSSFWNIVNAAYSGMTVSGDFSVGGCIGSSNSSYLLHLISAGNIKGQDSVGGILGVSVGTNRGKTAITLNAEFTNIPYSFRSIDDLADFSYETDHPWESGNYAGYTYDGEADWPTIQEEWSEDKPNIRSVSKLHPESRRQSDRDERISKIALDNRLIDAVFLGSVKCRNICGGIRGAGISKSLALAHALNSGYILASGWKSGQISGTANDDMPQFNIIQSGKISGPKPFKSFGEKAIGVACGIQFPLSSGLVPKGSDIFGNSIFGQRYSAKGISWYPEAYPKKILLVKPNTTTFSFSAEGLPVSKDLDISALTSKRQAFNFLKGDDSVFLHLPRYIESADYFWRRYLPPIPIKRFDDLPSGKCLDLSGYFNSSDAVSFSLLSNRSGINLTNSALCSQQPTTTGTIDLLAIKDNGGQLVFSIKLREHN